MKKIMIIMMIVIATIVFVGYGCTPVKNSSVLVGTLTNPVIEIRVDGTIKAVKNGNLVIESPYVNDKDERFTGEITLKPSPEIKIQLMLTKGSIYTKGGDITLQDLQIGDLVTVYLDIKNGLSIERLICMR